MTNDHNVPVLSYARGRNRLASYAVAAGVGLATVFMSYPLISRVVGLNQSPRIEEVISQVEYRMAQTEEYSIEKGNRAVAIYTAPLLGGVAAGGLAALASFVSAEAISRRRFNRQISEESPQVS